MRQQIGLWTVVLLLSWAHVADSDQALVTSPDCERYFVMIFGSESEPKRPKFTHSFACIIKATGRGADVEKYSLEVHTISWLPKSLDIHPLRLHPEEGRNLALFETLNWVMATHQRIYQWGPFEARRIVYLHAATRINESNRGEILYQCIDFPARSRVADCIHAVSDIDPLDSRLRFPIIRFGKDASRHIAEVFYKNGMFISPDLDYSWIHRRLGLGAYPIEVERLKRTSGSFERQIRRAERIPPPVIDSFPPPDLFLPEIEDASIRRTSSRQLNTEASLSFFHYLGAMSRAWRAEMSAGLTR